MYVPIANAAGVECTCTRCYKEMGVESTNTRCCMGIGGGGGEVVRYQILPRVPLPDAARWGGECTYTSCYKEIRRESVPKPNATRLRGSTYTRCCKEMGEGGGGGGISIPDTTRFG